MAKTNKTNKKIITLTSLVPLAVVPEAPPAVVAVVAAVVAAQSKSAFIRSCPTEMSAKEVVVLALAAGIALTTAHVHACRSAARLGRNGNIGRAWPAGAKATGVAKATDPKGRVIGKLQGTIATLEQVMSYTDGVGLDIAVAISALRSSLEAAHEMDAAWAPTVIAKVAKAPKGFQVGQLVDLTEKRRAQYEGILENLTGLVVVKVAGKSTVVATTDGVRMFLPTAHFCAHGTAAAAEVAAIAAQ